jgi:branched-chain amino acid transport system ATP-binding protein
MSAILEVRDLTKRFGGLTAVDGLDFVAKESEILGLIGPNGAGKSTVFSMVSGFVRPTSGDLLFEGRSLTGLQAFTVAELGIARVFQQSLSFGNISVAENVMVGFHRKRRASLVGSIVRSRKARTEEEEFRARADEIIAFVGLESVQNELPVNLPHGYQRLLSVATALATGPKLLLLDEPVTGMNPSELNHMVQLIRAIRERGMTVMLVEHHMKVVMGLCDRVVVLNYGRKIAEGTPQAVCNDPVVCEAYLGKKAFDAA